MKEYLKMSDVFKPGVGLRVGVTTCNNLEDNVVVARYIKHACESHDELVAEVERLRRQLACAFMAGWEEGINGMECDEAEVASIEIAEQFARN